ncbi:MFS transporter [Nocardia aurantiaca]|uniref:MFS transporter n=1 Tax=Nocardia aurantiaca TaxID=2675850 RepID=A0A6I3L1M3_9NOCA|nr:MFS transporter [Nocardia aurantiaca]MTE15168.1 MFS transporter [Nocardia aurantiaca]
MTVPATLPRSQQRLILAVLLLSSLLIWLDNTILATALETLADPVRGLGANPAQLQWASGSYTLVFAALMFTAGALGDRYGHRTVLATGLTIFALASIWAAYADDPAQLIAARAVMGVGSALIMPATMATVTWTFTGPARASAIGLFSTSAGVGLAAGPLLAGVLLDHFWWGSVFLVNVPVVVIALLGIATLVPNFRSPAPRPMNLTGLALSVSGLAALAYGLIRAGQVASWTPVQVWAPIAAGLALLAIFVITELRSAQPSFDPRLLADRIFGGGNATLGLVFLAMTASGFYGAFYLQGARGFSPLAAGLINSPAALGVIVGGPLSIRLVRRFSLRGVTATALTIGALCMGSIGFFGLRTPIFWNVLLSAAQGFSVGMVIGSVTSALMSTLPLDRAGAGSAVINTVRQTGSVLGIALGGTIMAITYRTGIKGAAASLPDSAREPAQVSAEQARHVASAVNRPDLAHAADNAFIHAMHVGAVWTMLFAVAGAAVLAVALRPRPEAAPATDPEPRLTAAGQRVSDN